MRPRRLAEENACGVVHHSGASGASMRPRRLAEENVVERAAHRRRRSASMRPRRLAEENQSYLRAFEGIMALQ